MTKLLLLLCALSFGAVRTQQDLNDLVGKKGDFTHFYDLYMRSGVPSAAGSSIGLYFEPTLSSTYGVDGLRLAPHIIGDIPYASMLAINSPVMDSGGSVDHLTFIDGMDVIGGRLSNYFLRSRKGHVLIGDTLTAARLLQQGGGLQYHAVLIRESRNIAADTEHVLVGAPDTTRLRDTLPLLSQAVGQDYLFILYHLSTADSGWVIYPRPGEKIDGYDSVILKSNLGRARLHLLGLGDRWRVLDHYEEGYTSLLMSEVSGTVGTSCLYSIDNLLNVKLRVLPVKGSSNSTANSFTLTGLNSNFTYPSSDTTYTAESSAIGLDSIATAMQCVLYGSGSNITCYRNDFASFRALGNKGLVYGLNFQFRLENPAPHL